MQTTKVFTEIMQAWLEGKRGILLQGGTSSTKTWSALQFLHVVAQSARDPLTISVISESLPHLKLGCIRDFFRIIGESQDNNPRWSKTEFVYTYHKASIEYWGTDNEGKARGPRRDILFVNEGNNVPWSTVQSADARTSKFVIVDWNPTGEFWVDQYESGGKLVPGWRHDTRFAYSHSTYQDAKKVLPPSVVANIESKRDIDPNWWNIYGLGILGNLEHIIWPNFQIVDDLPAKCDWGAWAYGLDFGYTNPAALVKVVTSGGKPYWDECLYQSGLTNADLIERLSHEDRADIYPDSAEPDRIEEIRRAGWNVFPANKDVKMGIDVVRRQTLYVTKRSVNLIKELRNYCRKKDRAGNVLEEPLKINDHGCDAGRYASMGMTERFGFATATPDTGYALVQDCRPSHASTEREDRQFNYATARSYSRR